MERGRGREKLGTTTHHYHMNQHKISVAQKMCFNFSLTKIKIIRCWLKKLDFYKFYPRNDEPFIPRNAWLRIKDRYITMYILHGLKSNFSPIRSDPKCNLNFWPWNPIGSKRFSSKICWSNLGSFVFTSTEEVRCNRCQIRLIKWPI